MTDRRALANHLYSEGYLLKEIAARLGVSHQRVSQLVGVPRRGRGNTRGKRYSDPTASPVASVEADAIESPRHAWCPPHYSQCCGDCDDCDGIGSKRQASPELQEVLREALAHFDPRSPEQAPEAEWKEGTWNR